MLYHFGHSRSAAGKINQHQIIGSYCFLSRWTQERIALFGISICIIDPAGSLCAAFLNQGLILQRRTLLLGILNVGNNSFILCTNNHFNGSRIDSVDQILLRQLKGSRNNNRSDFVKRRNSDPIFITPFHDQQNAISFMNPDRAKIVAHPVTDFLDITKCKNMFFPAVVTPDQRFFLGLFFRPTVYNIKTKIKIVRNYHFIIGFKILI